MKLHLVLKSKWYDKILSGEKNEEYRRQTEYWHKRIWLKRYHISSIVFHRGYTNITHERECVGITSWFGNKELGAPKDKVIILKLGSIIQ